jgi:hypothetical protein
MHHAAATKPAVHHTGTAKAVMEKAAVTGKAAVMDEKAAIMEEAAVVDEKAAIMEKTAVMKEKTATTPTWAAPAPAAIDDNPGRKR